MAEIMKFGKLCRGKPAVLMLRGLGELLKSRTSEPGLGLNPTLTLSGSQLSSVCFSFLI